MGGKQIIAGRYLVQRSLGRGGGGKVLLVKDLLQGERPLALKKVDLPAAGDSALLLDLKKEFAVISLLRHRNLEQVFDFGSTAREVFFTSEWIEGKDLVQAAEYADLNSILGLIVQLLRAVDFIHRRGVLHLDLKPGNILVTDPDATGEVRLKLIDFGIAQWKRHGRIHEASFFGTPPFAAPEIALGREPTPASDVYSLGMILHLLLAKRFPFPTQRPFQIFKCQTLEDPQHLGKFHPALPESFSDLLHRMVARDPRHRPKSSAEILEGLNRCLGEEFSLRSSAAPARFLEESDRLFHPQLLKHAVDTLAHGKGGFYLLAGPKGSGKTRMLLRAKALLQLRGVSSRYWSALEDPEALLRRGSGAKTPVLLDAPLSPHADLWRRLGKKKPAFPLVVAVEEIPEAIASVARETWRIPALTAASLGHFLKKELKDAPEDLGGNLLDSGGVRVPSELEHALQSLREAGLIAWSSEGWRWQGMKEADWHSLVERHGQLWQERKKTVGEILKSSGLTLPMNVLEGLLGLESGALEDYLREWSAEDGFLRVWEKGVACLRFRGADLRPDAPRGLTRDPAWLETQLKTLYEEGKYSVGVTWAEALAGEPPRALTPRIRVLAARHLVAEGFAKRALALLPKKSPQDFSGLYYEIKARALHLLNRDEDARKQLKLAAESYRRAEDGSGTARVLIFRGTAARGAGNWEEAELHFLAAIEQARLAGDPYCAGSARANLALAYQDQGKIEQALAAYRETWRECKKFFHPRLTNVLYHNWINLLQHMGRSGEAEKSCYEWLRLAIAHRYPEQEASALSYLAIFAGQKNHRELQGSFLNQAIGLLNPKKSPRLLAQLLANRALLFWSLEKFREAQRDGEAALRLCGERKNDPLLAWIFLVLGKVCRDRPRPDYARASRYFDRAERNVRQNHTLQLSWEVKLNQGKLLKLRGKMERARALLFEAHRALDDLEARLPACFKESYLRDRKRERIAAELKLLQKQPPAAASGAPAGRKSSGGE